VADAELDERLARELCREWLGPGATLEELQAMNSSTWAVVAQGERYVVKVSKPTDAPGLAVASWLEGAGMRTGAPVRTAVRSGRVAALLRYVAGRPLDVGDARRIGTTLGRVHALLRRAPAPDGLPSWPWPFLRPDVIAEPELRVAAEAAIARADALAQMVTHGILHGDPAPEAFVDDGADVGLIDWGSACHGPLLFDLASAWMYTDRSAELVDAYAAANPLAPSELALLPDFLALRWALQAWYFSERLRSGDLTGLSDGEDNEKGLADARAFLLRPDPSPT
jgi:Ser/Thr protein kinase RdoA (MazF antagonist)